MAVDNTKIKQSIKDILVHREIYERRLREGEQILQCLTLIEEDRFGNLQDDPQTGQTITDEKRQEMYDLWIPKALELVGRDFPDASDLSESSEESESEE